MRLARDLPNDITFDPPPWTWFIRKIQNPMKIRNGSTYVSSDRITFDRAGLTSKLWMLPVSSAVSSRLIKEGAYVGRVADLVLLVVLERDLDASCPWS